MNSPSYEGEIPLISPSGEIKRVHLPGRYKPNRGRDEGKVLLNDWDYDPNVRKKRRRQNQLFNKLLSEGWKIPTQEELDALEQEALDEWKKGTDEVNGSTQSGDQSHGGKHNSGEVDHPAQTAAKRPRGKRGRRKQKPRNKGGRRQGKLIKGHRSGKSGKAGASVYSKQPLQFNQKILKSAEQSAELLKQLVGRSHLKTESGIRIDIDALLIALEVGDNPLPALETPDERSRIKVLVTPDCSGSTQDWSGLGCAWAMHLANLPDTDVIYLTNDNGQLLRQDETGYLEDVETVKMLESVDVVIYLGDGDGYYMCRDYASKGATVVALDSFCARWAKARLTESKAIGKGHLYWVDRVSADVPDSWKDAIQLCLG